MITYSLLLLLDIIQVRLFGRRNPHLLSPGEEVFFAPQGRPHSLFEKFPLKNSGESFGNFSLCHFFGISTNHGGGGTPPPGWSERIPLPHLLQKRFITAERVFPQRVFAPLSLRADQKFLFRTIPPEFLLLPDPGKVIK